MCTYMRKGKFAIMILKKEKPLMEKRLKKHHLTFLEALPVDRAMICSIYGVIVPEKNAGLLEQVELCVVRGSGKNWIRFCKDPEMEILQNNIFEAYYNNEEES